VNRRGTLVLGLVAAAVAVPCLAGEPMTLGKLKELAAADARTPQGEAYLKKFFTNPWRLALDAADNACRPPKERQEALEEFVIALRIGQDGRPTDALVSPDDEYLRCVADRLKANGFIKPPHDGFAIYMPFRHTEPGTENQPLRSDAGTRTKP
jgi:hypothetical protein